MVSTARSYPFSLLIFLMLHSCHHGAVQWIPWLPFKWCCLASCPRNMLWGLLCHSCRLLLHLVLHWGSPVALSVDSFVSDDLYLMPEWLLFIAELHTDPPRYHQHQLSVGLYPKESIPNQVFLPGEEFLDDFPLNLDQASLPRVICRSLNFWSYFSYICFQQLMDGSTERRGVLAPAGLDFRMQYDFTLMPDKCFSGWVGS